jgi:paraquat-inducible protein A
MTLDTMGLKNSGTIFDGIISTWHTGYWFVAIILALTSIVFPLIKLLLIFWVSLNLKFKRIPGYLPQMMRLYVHSDEWGMLEVLMIGILVTIIKMHHMANIEYNTGFFCFTALMLTALGSSLALDKFEFWKQIENGRAPE